MCLSDEEKEKLIDFLNDKNNTLTFIKTDAYDVDEKIFLKVSLIGYYASTEYPEVKDVVKVRIPERFADAYIIIFDEEKDKK